MNNKENWTKQIARKRIKPAYRNWGVDRKFLPPKSIGYLNIKKKYRCPTRFPISSLMTLQGKKIISYAVSSEHKWVTIFCQLLLFTCHGHCWGHEPQKTSLHSAFCSHFFRMGNLQCQHTNWLFHSPVQAFSTVCTKNAITYLFTSGN